MPRSVVKTTIGNPFTVLLTVNSTNIYAMEQIQANLAVHGAAFFAMEQTNGRGQWGKHWEAKNGENILMSVVINPSGLLLSQQFHLQVVVSLACYDFLATYLPEELRIKWPNDIYWRDRKAGGILIENSIAGNKWIWAIAGIGININQTDFPELEQKAVSLKQITGKTYDPVHLAKDLCRCLSIRYQELLNGGIDPLLKTYQERLYKKGEQVRLKKDNVVGEYTIDAVTEKGELVATAGIEFRFTHGSVTWII